MLISFEGPGGCGKSTLIKEVSNQLNSEGIKHLLTKEPGSNQVPFCEEVRKLVLSKKYGLSSYTDFLLFMVDRLEHNRQFVIPNQSELILCDRGYISTEVYQIFLEFNNKIPDEFVSIHQAVVEIPDAIVFIATPLSLCLRRLKDRKTNEPDKFDEKQEIYITRAHKRYEEIMGDDYQCPKLIVDGTLPVSLTASSVIDFIKNIKNVKVR